MEPLYLKSKFYNEYYKYEIRTNSIKLIIFHGGFKQSQRDDIIIEDV